MNKKFFKHCALWLLMLPLIGLSGMASAEDNSPYHAFVKGSFAQIQEQHKGGPYIIAFWSETCTYCMKELEMFGQLLPDYPAVKLITVTTDPYLEDHIVDQILTPKKLGSVDTWVFADNFPERLYYDINPSWRGELPLTYFVGRDEKMIKHMGVVKEKELIEWLQQQVL